jgi:signal transduction histidine kinase
MNPGAPPRSALGLLAMSAPDPAQQVWRIRFFERNLGLPVKGVVLFILFLFLYVSNWVYDAPVNVNVVLFKVTWTYAQCVVQYAFLLYLAANFGVAFVLLGAREVPLPLVQWTVFTIALLDGLFLGALIAVTGGLESALHWLYLVLVVRNSLSLGATLPQFVLSSFMCLAYTGGVLLDLAIVRMDSLPPGDDTDTSAAGLSLLSELGPVFYFRIALMAALALWCWLLQFLWDRQRRRQDEQRELALRRQQMEASGRLAAEIAHQLKNPLAIINNASYTLQKTVKEGKTITQQIQIIREEVEKSDRLITELMGYAQLSEGRVERLDIHEELDRAVLQAFPPAVKYEVQIHRNYASSLPMLLAQRHHLSEAFVNILQNAREALNGRGNIWLTTAPAPDSSVVIDIADDGPGIPPQNLERIFTPYYSTREKGTGLGLAIVRHNVEMYGGRVRVESELGKGARFILTFPARTAIQLRK